MLKWAKYAFFAILPVLLSFLCNAQSNPTPFNLSSGNYNMTSWSATSLAGVYPISMRFHTCSVDSNPSLGDPTTGDYNGLYNVGTGNRFMGLSTSGFGFVNRVKTPVTVGAAVLSLNTTGRSNIFVSWNSATSGLGNAYNIRLQYRLSSTSAWLDVPGPVEYAYNGSTTNNQTLSVNLSLATAYAVDNRPDLQIRWKFYYVSGFAASGCLLTVDEISVSSGVAPLNSITTGTPGASSFCISPSTGSPLTIPFTYNPAANFASGSCTFTALLSNAAGQFTAPTILGSVVSNASGSQSISGIIPPGISSGSGYRVTVISDVPTITGADNGSNLSVQLSPGEVSGPVADCQNGASAISWTGPSTCYDEIMLVASAGVPVNGIPSGNGSAYTANSVFGGGTSLGNGNVVYKGTGNAIVVSNLTNNSLYYYKIWVRYGNTWSSGTEISCTPCSGSTLRRGDLAVLAVSTDNGNCNGQAGSDEISFVCFKDILNGTSIDLTDNGWQNGQANRWGNTEACIRLNRSGGTIAAGTIITMRFNNNGTASAIAPDAAWTISNIGGNAAFNLDNGGDQFFFLFGGNWNQGNTGSNDATYSGTVLFGFNSKSTWYSLTNYPGHNQESYAYPNLDCYSVAAPVAGDWIKFTGTPSVSLATKTQRNWIDSINDAGKWVRYADCASFASSMPNYISEPPVGILPGSYTRGKWTGSSGNNWFSCDNWEDFNVPDSSTNVWIPSSGVLNNCRLQANRTHYCRDLSIDGYELNGADTNIRILSIHGNLNINGGVLNFSDNNPNTKDGVIRIRGHWNNYNENAFREGNSKVVFEGTAPQNIQTPIRENFWQTEISNTGGVVTGTQLQIQNLLTFTSGVISTGSGEVYITTNNVSSIAGYGIDKFVNGKLRRQIGLSGTYHFPVGTTSTGYELASLNFTSQTGMLNVLTSFNNPTNGTAPNPATCTLLGNPIVGMLNAGHWTITPNAVPSTINYDLTLNERGYTNPVGLASGYGIIRRNNPTSNWLGTGVGIHNNATQTQAGGTVSAFRSAINNVLAFGDFGIGFINTPLPVVWISIKAWPVDNDIRIEWKTTDELNNDHFVIERSADGVNFDAIGSTYSNGGNAINTYYFTDISPLRGISYYRIRQVDFNGLSDYSPVVPVNLSTQISGLQLSPNPVRDHAWLSLQSTETTDALIDILGADGRLIRSEQYSLQKGSNGLQMDFSRLNPGVYLIRQGKEVLRLVKQ